jgi:uncharacterized membrane protein YfcA
MLSLLAFVAGLGIGLAQGLVAAGGALLAVPILVYLFGQDAQASTTSALVIVAVISVLGTLDRARRGGVYWQTAAIFGVAAVPGGVFGTVLNRLLSDDVLLLGFSLWLFAAAYAMLRGRAGPANGTHGRGRTPLVLVLGFLVGTGSGLFGVAGGFLIFPALTLWLGFSAQLAVGTSHAIQVVTSGAALTAHVAAVSEVDWILTAAVTAGSMFGALGGARLGERLSSERLSKVFALGIVLVGVFVFGRNLARLLS